MDKRSRQKKRKKRARQRAFLFLFSTASMVLFTVLAVKAMTRQETSAGQTALEHTASDLLPGKSGSVTEACSVSPQAALKQEALKQLFTMLSQSFLPAKTASPSSAAIAERKNPQVPLIAVDPGHGGEDEGCSFDGIMEKDINLSIGLRLEEQLSAMGYEVRMTRRDDSFVDKYQRAEMANIWQADIYVSIHQNTYEDSSASGIETWYSKAEGAQESGRLANLLHREVLNASGAVERELKEDADFAVNTKTTMPSCLIETGFLSNPEERVRLNQEDYQIRLAQGIAKGINSYFHPKTMYLTFDDGPSAENTAAILDILKARNIKATFFVVGENVRKNPEMAKRMAAEGHTIGIHCNRHDYEALYSSTDSFLQDFDKAYQAVYEVTGVKAQLFRFPGGSINAYNKAVYRDIIREMTARGFVYFDWNASLEDALKKSEPGELIANARETAMGRKRVVMLAHDIVHSTALCLEELIDQFPEYQMEPLTTEVKPVQFQP